ncbi:MAG: 1-acyl-sn-glycerol-3-phosphate acyltransferase, partial [Alphaproteobacteria bacterium]|nr:1-acyl-sn-glycerol-3-phosphate acyltransferase [Alphaproteobacteria bacterium]
MKYLRAIWFNLTFYGTNLVMSALLMGSLLFPRHIIVKAVWLWLAAVAWVEKHAGGIGYRVRGRENLP